MSKKLPQTYTTFSGWYSFYDRGSSLYIQLSRKYFQRQENVTADWLPPGSPTFTQLLKMSEIQFKFWYKKETYINAMIHCSNYEHRSI